MINLHIRRKEGGGLLDSVYLQNMRSNGHTGISWFRGQRLICLKAYIDKNIKYKFLMLSQKPFFALFFSFFFFLFVLLSPNFPKCYA